MNKSGYVYILSSHSRVLYIGVTSDLKVRLFQHHTGTYKGFTSDYNVHASLSTSKFSRTCLPLSPVRNS